MIAAVSLCKENDLSKNTLASTQSGTLHKQLSSHYILKACYLAIWYAVRDPLELLRALCAE